MTPRFGASAAEWNHFDLILELGTDLLPVVSNPGATISPNSKISALGKTPSRYNVNGHTVGIPDWGEHFATDVEIAAWSRQPDYGICVITREVRGLDVDVPDEQLAGKIRAFIDARIELPARTRSNSGKFLLAFDLPGEFFKRRMSVDGGIIEFLGTGQQFVAIGTHPSGARYEWESGLPQAIPAMTAAAFEQLWADLERTFATEPATTGTAAKKTKKLAEVVSNDPVAKHMLDRGLVLSIDRSGRHDITCPFADDHTSESAESATSYWPPNTGGFERGHFKCMHAHCEGRTDEDYIEAIGYEMPAAIDEFLAPVTEPIAEQVPHRFDPVPAWKLAEQPPRPWLIKRIIPRAAIVLLFGESTSGKTFLALDMAMAIARGIEWRGSRVKQGRVVYIAAEDTDGVLLRMRAYCEANGVTLADIPVDVIGSAPSLLDKTQSVDVAKRIAAGGETALVVIDTVAKVTAGGNENSGEDMGLMLLHADGIHRATGAVVLLIHHAGKDASKGARGWSGMRAGVDAELEVRRVGECRSVTVSKQKNGRDGGELGFALEVVHLGEDEDGEPITSCVVKPTDIVKAPRGPKDGPNERAVMSVIVGMVGVTNTPVNVEDVVEQAREQLIKGDGKDRRTEFVRKALASLRDKNRIEVSGGRVCLC